MDTLSSLDGIQVRNSGFDPLGPAVHNLLAASGRSVNYIDDGDPDAVPLVFLGGAGTTVRAFRLLEFARSFRQELGIRVISVERNGLGQSEFDPTVGFAEYAEDLWSVLDSLDIGIVSVIAISGGGPYAAHLVAAQPDRIRSLHLACAFGESIEGAGPRFDADTVAADPVAWWRFPAESSVHTIPGFDDSVIEEATRGLFAKGRDRTPEGLQQAFDLYATTPLPNLAAVRAPVFLYWGNTDELVPLTQLDRWKASLDTGTTRVRVPGRTLVERVYPGEGHDVQYRHWDQILVDVAYLGSRIVASRAGETLLLDPAHVELFQAAGGTLGLAAWESA